jgi:UDP-N-acetylmuramoyl-L-alanyl-D-glutamate--2,6-diaminopimelate ligase
MPRTRPGRSFTQAALALNIKAVAHDSRTVKPGTLFASLPPAGKGPDRQREYLAQAVAQGAVAVLAANENLDTRLPLLVSEDPRRAYAWACAAFFGHPSRQMKLAGVTGTNGKTTTTFLLRSIFEKAGLPCGLVGTVGYWVGKKKLEAPNTTPSALDLQSLMARELKAGGRAMSMEVSSHALDQGRVEGCEFDAAVFTNLTQDHLDYHGDMHAYARAKGLFFENLGQGSKGQAVAVLNRDDPAWAYFQGRTPKATRKLTYSLKDPKADVMAEQVKLDLGGSRFKLKLGSKKMDVAFPLTGRFNISNALAAAAAAYGMGLAAEAIAAGLKKPQLPPGRLEKVEAGQPFLVLVDYAHTPDALERVLDTLKEFAPARILTVFGCGGERDRGKRPKMGRIAYEKSDLVLVTSDNPRGEDPEKIMAQVMEGIPDERGQVRRAIALADRRQAISRALKVAEPKDIVLIAGKGHESTQIIGAERLPFDDRKVALQILKARKKKAA